MKMPIYKHVITAVSALLILLFVYTAISKLKEQEVFELVLSKSPLIGNMAGLLSSALPFAELLAAMLLFMPLTRSAGLWLSLVLMILFTGYIGYMLAFSEKLPCSCGGVLKKMSWEQHLLFNIFFTTLTAYGLWLTRKNQRFIAINRVSQKPV